MRTSQMAPRSKKKPLWIVEKERQRSAGNAETVWLFGLHAVRDALENPMRERIRLMVTKNASDKLSDSILKSGINAEVIDPRKFNPPIDPQSVHQGAALEVKPLDWGNMSTVCAPRNDKNARLVILDRVTDPHNVGAILRSAEVFGARAVIATARNSAPETGAPVSGAEFLAVAITALAPNTSADRNIAPTLCGSVTLSRITNLAFLSFRGAQTVDIFPQSKGFTSSAAP